MHVRLLSLCVLCSQRLPSEATKEKMYINQLLKDNMALAKSEREKSERITALVDTNKTLKRKVEELSAELEVANTKLAKQELPESAKVRRISLTNNTLLLYSLPPFSHDTKSVIQKSRSSDLRYLHSTGKSE